jgi:hypothetical protein
MKWRVYEGRGEFMKISFRKHKCSWFLVFSLAAILAIVACNVWLFCCGRCSLNDYLQIPTIGWILIAANLIAGLILFAVQRRNSKKSCEDFCYECRICLRDTWLYCPNCGGVRSH